MASVELAFRVLAEVARGARDAEAVARSLSAPQDAIEAAVASLLRAGALTGPDGNLRISGSVEALAQNLLGQDDRIEIARPILRELATRLGATAALAIADGDGVRMVVHAAPSDRVGTVLRVDDAVPLHGSAAGVALLSLLPEGAVEAYLERVGSQLSPSRLDRLALIEGISAVRDAGWIAMRIGNDLAEAAAPVRADGAPTAVVVLGPTDRIPPRRGEEAFAAALTESARLVAEQHRSL